MRVVVGAPPVAYFKSEIQPHVTGRTRSGAGGVKTYGEKGVNVLRGVW